MLVGQCPVDDDNDDDNNNNNNNNLTTKKDLDKPYERYFQVSLLPLT